jgi:hypothetical protein
MVRPFSLGSPVLCRLVQPARLLAPSPRRCGQALHLPSCIIAPPATPLAHHTQAPDMVAVMLELVVTSCLCLPRPPPAELHLARSRSGLEFGHRVAPGQGSSSSAAASQVEHARGLLPTGAVANEDRMMLTTLMTKEKGVRSVRQISTDGADPHLT